MVASPKHAPSRYRQPNLLWKFRVANKKQLAFICVHPRFHSDTRPLLSTLESPLNDAYDISEVRLILSTACLR